MFCLLQTKTAQRNIRLCSCNVWTSVATKGCKGDICPRAQDFGSAIWKSECCAIWIWIIKNVDCERLLPSCEILSRTPWFAKASSYEL